MIAARPSSMIVTKTPLWIEFEGAKRTIDQILYAKLTTNMDFTPASNIKKPSGSDFSASPATTIRKDAVAALLKEMKLGSTRKPVAADMSVLEEGATTYGGLPDFAWDAMPTPHPADTTNDAKNHSVGSDMLDHRYHVVYKRK